MSCIAQPTSGEEKSRAMVTATGYCYSDAATSSTTNIQTHMGSHLQGFEHNTEIYNLTPGMEIVGFPHKNLQQQQSETSPALWKGFFNKSENSHHYGGPGPSSSKSINEPSPSEFYHYGFIKPAISTDAATESLMVAPGSSTPWHEHRMLVEDPSLRCVFPCEANEKPSQGLSLSLSSSNPSSMGFQSFELRQHDDDVRFVASSSRINNGFFNKPVNDQNQQQMVQDGFLGKAANMHYQSQFLIRNSKYLAPAQELLNEFCNLRTKQTDDSSKLKLQKTNQLQEENNASSSSKQQSLCTLDLLELQKRKTRLLQMLEEVDRRYKHYCDQMKGVISSFEAVAGNGAATVYSALASKAMSRHFRCLRDAVVAQIKATRKAMGEKDTVAPGTTRGETPRLRILDQNLRQQRAFQQMSMMESHPWRPQRGLPERSVSVLRAWLFEHFLHPYPNDVDKHILARQTGLSRSQVSNWFINARVRLWKPMVEEMYLEELKEQENADSIDGQVAAAATEDQEKNGIGRQNQNPHHQQRSEDQKPTHDQLVRIDSECLSSIINNPPEKNDGNKKGKNIQDQGQPHSIHHLFGRAADSLSGMELDFSSYNHNSASAHVHFANENAHHHNYNGGTSGGGNGNGGGGGVSLTLGLQQHGGSGVSLAFSPASQSSLFYPRDHIEDCQPVQYSLLDNDQGQNLPYRNLMGAQLLHDLAG